MIEEDLEATFRSVNFCQMWSSPVSLSVQRFLPGMSSVIWGWVEQMPPASLST